MIQNTAVLNESQIGVLQIALEVVVDRFRDHVRALTNAGPAAIAADLADQFERQAETARELLSLVTDAESITITEIE
jgi:hypothetical protein